MLSITVSRHCRRCRLSSAALRYSIIDAYATLISLLMIFADADAAFDYACIAATYAFAMPLLMPLIFALFIISLDAILLMLRATIAAALLAERFQIDATISPFISPIFSCRFSPLIRRRHFFFIRCFLLLDV